MTDPYSKEKRSYNMSRIRSKDTKPEMVVRRFLHANGFRYRLHVKELQGKPDIVLSKHKTVIFVHGCFWHSHEGCSLNRIPKKNKEYWIPKLAGNVLRDQKHKEKLNNDGWRIIIIWECELRNNIISETLYNLLYTLTSRSNSNIV